MTRFLTIGLLFLFTGVTSAAPRVAGYERHKLKPVDAGWLLINELNCTACHEADTRRLNRLAPRTGPDLSRVAARLNPTFLEPWIAAPHSIKAGTVMPDLLAGYSPEMRRKEARLLASFLSVQGEPTAPASRPDEASVEAGRGLYGRIGCVACHEPDYPDAAGPDFSGVSLGNLREKYQYRGLLAFLKNPLETRHAARMPDVPLDDDEAKALSDFLWWSHKAREALRVDADPGLAAAGRQRFEALRCIACHTLDEPKPALPNGMPGVKPLAKLDPDTNAGCLSPDPKAGIPHYRLNARQSRVIRLALASPAPTIQEARRQQLELRLRAFNCLACHERNGEGGPPTHLNQRFTSNGEDLGDEGRLPPTLTGVGQKLNPSALRQVLEGEGSVRPYMNTRMPGFGGVHAGVFTEAFVMLDRDPDEYPTAREGRENEVGRNQAGRHLMGTKGLSCISCHDLNGHRSLGIRAMDLAHTPRRLRPEWFRDYLLDPARFRPGTRMPAFWPDSKPAGAGLSAKTERDIDSLWVYLNELDQTRLPFGLERTNQFELKPGDQPVVFRTFLEGVGFHAVAVGFSNGVHAAFDARTARWALGWRGRFLDAESVWDDRFTPMAKPLGTAVVSLVSLTPYPWDRREASVRFNGYRLDERGVPSFHYTVNETVVRDRLVPKGTGFVRHLELEHPPAAFACARGERIELMAPNRWRINGQLTLSIPDERVRGTLIEAPEPGQFLLMIAPVVNGQKARMEMEWSW